MTAKEQAKKRLIKVVGHEIVDGGKFGRWFWQGTQYCSFGWCGTCGINAYVRFTANFGGVRAEVQTEQQYGIPDVEKAFKGENAMQEAVEWTADRLYDLYQTVSKKTAPYKQGHESYMKALRGA